MVGILNDDVDPLVNVMPVEKAPLESYADVGGLSKQIQEVKVSPQPSISNQQPQPASENNNICDICAVVLLCECRRRWSCR